MAILDNKKLNNVVLSNFLIGTLYPFKYLGSTHTNKKERLINFMVGTFWIFIIKTMLTINIKTFNYKNNKHNILCKIELKQFG